MQNLPISSLMYPSRKLQYKYIFIFYGYFFLKYFYTLTVSQDCLY